jgi:hypothetical protein
VARSESEGEIAPYEVRKACDMKQAYEFKPWVHARIGHLQYLKVGSHECRQDTSVARPTDPVGSSEAVRGTKVAGVLQSASWTGEELGAITLVFKMSKVNRQDLLRFTLPSGTEDTEEFEECQATFVVYEYDSVAHRYYRSFHTNDEPVKGVFKAGKDLRTGSDDDERSSLITLTFEPKGKSELHLGFSATKPMVKTWGTTESEAASAESEDDFEDDAEEIDEEVGGARGGGEPEPEPAESEETRLAMTALLEAQESSQRERAEAVSQFRADLRTAYDSLDKLRGNLALLAGIVEKPPPKVGEAVAKIRAARAQKLEPAKALERDVGALATGMAYVIAYVQEVAEQVADLYNSLEDFAQKL